MNTTSHPFAPEEIMALLDGELPASEAHAVTAHLAACAECADLAEQFRSTSQWLARWEVEPVPARMEAAVHAAISPVSKRHTGWSPRSWKPWTLGALAAASFAVALILFSPRPRYLASHLEPAGQRKSESLVDSYSKVDSFTGGGLEQSGRGAGPGKSKQFHQLDRAATLMAPPAIKRPPPPPPPPALAASFADAPPLQPGSMVAPHTNGQSQGLIPLTATAPMIARAVSMSVVVKDVAASRAALDSILLRHHGYPAQLEVTTPENGARAFNASLRIPAPELAAALAECKGLGRVEDETQSGEEVTQQHADLLARLHNARETEERFRAILAQRTGKVSDVLEVEQSIAQVRGEIEQMEAEQQTLEHRVNFATVDLQLTEQYKASLDTPSDAAGPRLHNAFVAGYRNASDTVVGIILFFAEYGPSILIWLAILGIPASLVWRHRSRT